MTTPKNPGDALAAFDKWLESRSLSTEKLDPKEWGHATYKHSHIQAMWEGWEAALTPSPDYVMVPREVITDLQGTLNYIAVQGKANHPGFAQVARMNAEDAVKRLQPYTKGE